MPDTRYLKQRGRNWSFQLAVPRDVSGSWADKDPIIKALGTSDLREAQRLRWRHYHEAQEAFKKLRGGEGLTAAEVEQEATKFHSRILADANAARKAGRANPWGAMAPRGDEAEGLDVVLGLLGDAFGDEDFAPVLAVAEEIVARRGAVVEEGSAAHAELCKALLRAYMEAVQDMQAWLMGERRKRRQEPFNPAVIDPETMEPVVPENVLRPAAKLRQGQGVKVSEAAERFLAQKMRDPDAKIREQTKGHYVTTFRLFEDFTTNAAVAAIERDTVAEFIDTLGKLNVDWGRSPKTKGRSLPYLLEHFSYEPHVSNRTLNGHLRALAGLFKWAKGQGLYVGDNPCTDLTRKTPKKKATTKYATYTTEELNGLFHAPLFTDTPRDQRVRPKKFDMKAAMLWVPLVGLFSGMRSGEICQLRANDVKQKDGVWFFDVHEEHEGAFIKNEPSIRQVPVHPELIRCGFLDYLKSAKAHPNGQLWPGLKPGGPDKKLNAYFVKRFVDFRRAAGVDRPRLGFHSFRHQFKDACRAARIEEEVHDAITGHTSGTEGRVYGSEGVPLDVKAEAMAKVTYPGAVLRHLYLSKI